jgi:hypothetical protein
MNRSAGLALLLCWTALLASSSRASQRLIPIPELTAISDGILTGKIVRLERTETQPGVFEITASIRVDAWLKGPLKTQMLQIENKTVEVVQIRFWDGPNVPSGKVVHALGDEGLWFLTRPENTPNGPYQGDRREASELAEVKRLLGDEPPSPEFKKGGEFLWRAAGEVVSAAQGKPHDQRFDSRLAGRDDLRRTDVATLRKVLGQGAKPVLAVFEAAIMAETGGDPIGIKFCAAVLPDGRTRLIELDLRKERPSPAMKDVDLRTLAPEIQGFGDAIAAALQPGTCHLPFLRAEDVPGLPEKAQRRLVPPEVPALGKLCQQVALAKGPWRYNALEDFAVVVSASGKLFSLESDFEIEKGGLFLEAPRAQSME